MAERIKYMDVAEFVSEGYLQELNRLFLHPLGLAMETVVDIRDNGERGPVRLGGIWDYRDDPEGIRFGDKDLAPKARDVQALWDAREPDRIARLGWMVQPVSRDPG